MNNQDTENILKELNEIAPTLAKLPKKSDLSVPPNYFEEVEGQIVSQLNLLKYDAATQVPHGYLDRLESDVVNWATRQEQKKFIYSKIINISHFSKWVYASAAVFILVICTTIVFNIQREKSSLTALSVHDQDQYFDYIQDNIDEFDINILIENDLVEESDLSLVVFKNESFDTESNTFMESEISF